MPAKKWKYIREEIRKNSAENEVDSSIQKLSSSLNISDLLGELLWTRGVRSLEEAKAYFRPSGQSFHDPFLLLNMTAACDRLHAAIQNQENVLLYGDYDVDGTTSATILYLFLQNKIDQLSYWIPDRYTEGYGLSEQGVEAAIDNGIDLVITLDCGIKAKEKIAKLKTEGIDVIVCDHHLPDQELPEAIVVNPKQLSCSYPNQELAAVGVTYKLIEGMCKAFYPAENPEYLLDFVALGTGADLVPLTGENRLFVQRGLEKINRNPSSGIQSILHVAGCKGPIAMKEIGFSIGPRINAAGRIGKAIRVVDLFVSGDRNIEEQLSREISEENEVRRTLDKQCTQEALSVILSRIEDPSYNLVFRANWNKGILGIVASRIQEQVYKPTIVLCQSGDLITGSARSIPGFNITSALERCSHLLESFGGHAFAAGLSLKPENLPAFEDAFAECTEVLNPTQFVPSIEIDAVINLHDLNQQFFSIYWQMEPFGQQNSSANFVVKNVLALPVRVMGQKHLKFSIYHENDPDYSFEVVAFNAIEHYDRINSGEAFDICVTPELNHWNNESRVQLRMLDIR